MNEWGSEVSTGSHQLIINKRWTIAGGRLKAKQVRVNVVKASSWQFKLCECCFMMTSSNGNIFRVTGHLCGEFTGPGELPTERPVMRSFDFYFDLRPNKRSSKQLWGWWFETPLRPLWRHRNEKWTKCPPPVQWLVQAKEYEMSSACIWRNIRGLPVRIKCTAFSVIKPCTTKPRYWQIDVEQFLFTDISMSSFYQGNI